MSPFVVGWIGDATGSTNGLCVIAASLVFGGAIVLQIAARGSRRRAS